MCVILNKNIILEANMKKEIGKETSQQLVIDTPWLLVKGNIMSWDGTMIQLSNVSCISTAPLVQVAFPLFSIAFLLMGLLTLKYNLIVSIILLGLGGVLIYNWYKTNEERKKNTILNIVMNSGNSLQFVINNRNFLDKVLKVLEQIIIDGGVGNQNVSINIQGCRITGNAKVLNDLNLS